MLTEAAIKGKGGPAHGPEGKRYHRQTVPAGTGMQVYTDTQVVTTRTDDPYVNALRGLLENEEESADTAEVPQQEEAAEADQTLDAEEEAGKYRSGLDKRISPVIH